MENKNYGLYYVCLCGDVIVELQDERGKKVACHSDYHGNWIGDDKVSYKEFERFVEDTTGRNLKWEWDEDYQVYFPYLEAV